MTYHTYDSADMAREILRDYDNAPTSELQIVPVPASDADRWPAWVRIRPPIGRNGEYVPHFPDDIA